MGPRISLPIKIHFLPRRARSPCALEPLQAVKEIIGVECDNCAKHAHTLWDNMRWCVMLQQQLVRVVSTVA
jgi:hypothetical protein